MIALPRLLLCAPSSGSGKTTVTCALLQALRDRGLRPAAFKSGPDYIDPMFHSRVLDTRSRNLDLFLMGRDGVLSALARAEEEGCAPAVLEGAMGYYDGIAMTHRASAYDLARTTATPAVLVVDARGQALSAAAVAAGMLRFRTDSGIRGVIFNRISPMLYPRLRDCVEGETGLKAYGFLPPCPDSALESRHLGLVTAAEVPALREKMQTLARQAEQTLDIDGLLALAGTAPGLPRCAGSGSVPRRDGPRIAVAMDRAFCFYYADGLALLEQLGARLCPFSPLTDSSLPEGTAGLYLGGGYPELYARELSENGAMRAAVRRAVEGGMPTVAECGGFLYLHDTLEGEDGRDWPMAGVVRARAFRTDRLGRFGYIAARAGWDGLLCPEGAELPAHEFHYWDSTAPGSAFRAKKPGSDRGWSCGYHTGTLYAGFPHFHFCGIPGAAERFVAACGAYEEAAR